MYRLPLVAAAHRSLIVIKPTTPTSALPSCTTGTRALGTTEDQLVVARELHGPYLGTNATKLKEERQHLPHFEMPFLHTDHKNCLRCTTKQYSSRPPLICRGLPQLHYTYITHVHTISDWHARQDAAIFGGLTIIYQNTMVKFQIQNRYIP